MFDANKAFKPRFITDEQAERVDNVTSAFCNLWDTICEYTRLVKDQTKVEYACKALQEAKFWLVEAICKEEVDE